MWYTRAEQALVIGAFYSMNGFQQCVGGLIGYGISQIQGQHLKNWQILFTVGVFHAARDEFLNLHAAAWMPDLCLGSVRPVVASGQPYAGHVLVA